MPLEDMTWRLGTEGIVLNDDPTVFGDPFVDIMTARGFDSAPPRTAENDHEGVDGGFVDAEFEKARPVALEGVVYATSDTIMRFLDTLKENWSPSTVPVPLYVKYPLLGERVLNIKPLGCSYDITTAYRLGTAPIMFQGIAEDPAFYDATYITTTVPLGALVFTGRSYPKSYNFGYGSTTAIADGQTIVNTGNRRSPAVLRINGPSVNPTIIHDTSSSRLDFNITVPTGSYLEIDLRSKTVRLDGTANRRTALLAPNWFMLSKGENFIRYQAQTGSTGSSLDIVFSPAWR